MMRVSKYIDPGVEIAEEPDWHLVFGWVPSEELEEEWRKIVEEHKDDHD